MRGERFLGDPKRRLPAALQQRRHSMALDPRRHTHTRSAAMERPVPSNPSSELRVRFASSVRLTGSKRVARSKACGLLEADSAAHCYHALPRGTLMSAADSNRTDIPLDLQAILDDLDNSDREAREVIGGLSDVQANWQPRETAWSVAQCLDHLARAGTQYSAAMREAITSRAPRKSGARGRFGREGG